LGVRGFPTNLSSRPDLVWIAGFRLATSASKKLEKPDENALTDSFVGAHAAF
jgi:hypothetical protein